MKLKEHLGGEYLLKMADAYEKETRPREKILAKIRKNSTNLAWVAGFDFCKNEILTNESLRTSSQIEKYGEEEINETNTNNNL